MRLWRCAGQHQHADQQPGQGQPARQAASADRAGHRRLLAILCQLHGRQASCSGVTLPVVTFSLHAYFSLFLCQGSPLNQAQAQT